MNLNIRLSLTALAVVSLVGCNSDSGPGEPDAITIETIDQSAQNACIDGASVLLVNGKIHTMDASSTVANKILIEQGRIAAINPSSNDAECVIDLEGKTVIPGLIDNHVHFSGSLFSPGYDFHDAESATSLEDLLARLGKRVQQVPSGELISALGPVPIGLFGAPSLSELDQITPEHPVILAEGFGGPAYVNTLAKDFLESLDNTLMISDSGVVPPNSRNKVIGMLRQIDSAESTLAAAKEYMYWANSLGITMVSEAGLQDPGLYDLWEQGELSVKQRIRYMTPVFGGEIPPDQLNSNGQYPIIDIVQAGMDRVGEGDSMLKVLGVGEFSAGGFNDTMSNYYDVWDAVAQKGWNMAQHAIFEDEIEAHLSAFETLSDQHDLFSLQWSLEHLLDITPGQVDRLKATGVAASVHNVSYVTAGSSGWAGAPYRTLVDSGIVIGAGSDSSNIGAFNPWLHTYFMVTGKNAKGDLINDGEQILRDEALRIQTIGSAWTVNEQDIVGSLEIGKAADLAVLNSDFMSIPESGIRDISSLLTLIDGRVVYPAIEK